MTQKNEWVDHVECYFLLQKHQNAAINEEIVNGFLMKGKHETMMHSCCGISAHGFEFECVIFLCVRINYCYRCEVIFEPSKLLLFYQYVKEQCAYLEYFPFDEIGKSIKAIVLYKKILKPAICCDQTLYLCQYLL